MVVVIVVELGVVVVGAVVDSVEVSEASKVNTVVESVDAADGSAVDMAVVDSADGSAVDSLVASLGATVDVVD